MNEVMNRILNMRTMAEFEGLLAQVGVKKPDLLQTICTLAMEQLPPDEAKAFVLVAATEYDKDQSGGLERAAKRPPIFRQVEDELMQGLAASLKKK
ncbi:protein of unknown function [Bradyrhizobium sp. ORS 285]|uniref:hypothetical protein n=1 Tax=Bradyrhizobium sp. ORS 285 TaxID=115808 RepID=UPI00024095A6|nr:hypothetical protein [Bradyrhizobium sp. ORS 285]CCD89866.1 hypothetical protein BRAO285_850072 [Bradyrhizobium sp. ORS 285]SMX61509.1 protein of unknown function [Bradyrhizobium sp. ORS 285]